MEELKKCPFCHEELETIVNGRYYAHKINGCILQPLCFECDDIWAIKAWNTRKPMGRVLERLEEIPDYLHRQLKGDFVKKKDVIDIIREEMS